jgi:hypothetical protein
VTTASSKPATNAGESDRRERCPSGRTWQEAVEPVRSFTDTKITCTATVLPWGLRRPGRPTPPGIRRLVAGDAAVSAWLGPLLPRLLEPVMPICRLLGHRVP